MSPPHQAVCVRLRVWAGDAKQSGWRNGSGGEAREGSLASTPACGAPREGTERDGWDREGLPMAPLGMSFQRSSRDWEGSCPPAAT